MHLVEFTVTNYRSINDSGPVAVGELTSLVGRNESGRTNLLLALSALNPVGGLTDLSPIKDFPRHRRLSECTEDTQVLKTTWELDAEEQQELVGGVFRAAGIPRVEIGRYYKARRWVHFPGLKPLEFSASDVDERLRRISSVASAAAEELADDGVKSQASAVIAKFAQDVEPTGKPEEWASRAARGAGVFRQALAGTGINLPDPRRPCALRARGTGRESHWGCAGLGGRPGLGGAEAADLR